MQSWSLVKRKCAVLGAIFLLLALAIPAGAEVVLVSGDVSGTWTADTVLVTDSIYVSPGNTLVIEPGVDVLFIVAYSFRVYSGATLQAVGTEDEMINFLPFTSGYNTLGVEFVDASDESILEYCHFTHALYSATKLMIR